MSTAFSSVSSQSELFPLTVMTQHGCLLPATPGLTPYAQRTIRRAINLLDKYAWQLRLRIHRRLPHSMLTTFTRVNMKTLPATTQRAAKLCLSPVAVWQMLLAHLLEQHYGLILNDTPFSDEAVIQEHINAGINLADAVNFLVEKYELVRIDRRGFNWQEQSPYLRAVDILRARQATGLLRRSRKNAVR